MEALLKTDLKETKFFKRGKVRDIYELDDRLLIVATDRLSAFDVVLPTGIPLKGEVLTRLSEFWFDFTSGIIGNHYITTEVWDYEELGKKRSILEGRAMLVRKTNPVQVECVVRGYLSGSAWKEYKKSGGVCGIELPGGLQESQKLAAPLFTPSTKATSGHDENITFEELESLVGGPLAAKLRDVSLEVYSRASEYAEERGIIIADTKFEFGTCSETDSAEEELMLIDELLTPDSSRFWPRSEYEPGRGQPSFDKQFVRDYLEGTDWNKTPPAPELPSHIVDKTSEKYVEAYKRIVGKDLPGQERESHLDSN
jgi:phosphoribosylaminoimidazole-succinocarboxamide synthase